VERVVLNALGTTVLPLEIFCANKALERLAFGNSIVLEDKTIHFSAGLRLRLAGYLGRCPSPRSK
jgi:hypothetical protein